MQLPVSINTGQSSAETNTPKNGAQLTVQMKQSKWKALQPESDLTSESVSQ